MDCFVLPNDETSGEFVHMKLKKVLEFRKIVEPGLFVSLDNLLDRAASGAEIPRKNLGMVIGRLKNKERKFCYLKALDEYPRESPEAEIWALVNLLFEKRLKQCATK
jgi:hypothetical protein